MKNLTLTFLFLSACAVDPPANDDARSTPASVVYPCAITIDETCRAAYDLASVVCDRRHACDELYDVPREQCIAWEMEGYCAEVTCYAPYGDRTELDVCLADYRAQACDGAIGCHL